jgi:hypothetical protein
LHPNAFLRREWRYEKIGSTEEDRRSLLFRFELLFRVIDKKKRDEERKKHNKGGANKEIVIVDRHCYVSVFLI